MELRPPKRPRLALTLGDPAGIGPEIVRAACRDERVRQTTDLVVLVPEGFELEGVPQVTRGDLVAGGDPPRVAQVVTDGPGPVELGVASRAGGAAALSALFAGAELAKDGVVDGLVTAPVCKEALHLAGEKVEGQTELLARLDGVTDYEMVAVAGEMRVMLLSRHLPLKRALESITTEGVVHHLELFARTLGELGFEAPRIALAGLNPHAGENGVLGSEEGLLLEPAVAAARANGIDVVGPLSPDTVFLDASRGTYTGVLALYHDQAFIPIKLLGAGRAVTLIAGLSYLRVSPAHGTAFDIVGRGLADPSNLIEALRFAAARVAARSTAAS